MLIHCGSGIFLGDNEACARGGFDHVVHFVRSPDDPNSCTAGRAGCELALTLTEGDPLGPVAGRLIRFARATTGSLLVHCQAGIYRSPHGVLLAAIGRGLDPAEMMGRLSRARWAEAGHAPQWQMPYLDEVFRRHAEGPPP